MPTIAITAPTPMMIPSAVSPDRILFLLNARRATLRVVKVVMRRAGTGSRFSDRGSVAIRSLATSKSKWVDGSLPGALLLGQADHDSVALLQPFDHLDMGAVGDAGFHLHRLRSAAFRSGGRVFPGEGYVNCSFGLVLLLLAGCTIGFFLALRLGQCGRRLRFFRFRSFRRTEAQGGTGYFECVVAAGDDDRDVGGHAGLQLQFRVGDLDDGDVGHDA